MTIVREMMVGESLTFRPNWAADLPVGAAIEASDWIVDDELTVAAESETSTATSGRLTFAGSIGGAYNATNRVTLDDDQVFDFGWVIKGVERVFTIYKDPDAIKDSQINWETAGIFAEGETITDKTYTAVSGITIQSSEIDGLKTNARLSGGTLGSDYRIPVSITTSNSQVAKCILLVRVRES